MGHRVLCAALLLLLPAAVFAQEDPKLARLLAECFEQGEGQDRSKLPERLCSYSADIRADRCTYEVQETVRLPHWPGGRFTLTIPKTPNQFYQDTVAFLLYKTGASRERWDYYTYDLGRPVSTDTEYLLVFEVAASKDSGVEFVYAYRVFGGISRNVECADQPNVDGSHILEWRAANWRVAAPNNAVIVNAGFEKNVTSVASSPDAAKLFGRDSITGRPNARFEFSPNDLVDVSAAVGLPAIDGCESTRQCLSTVSPSESPSTEPAGSPGAYPSDTYDDTDDGDEGLPDDTVCFDSGSTVKLADGSQKTLDDIVPGDLVQSVDQAGRKTFSEVFLVQHAGLTTTVRMLDILLENTTLRVTPSHYLRVSLDGETYLAAGKLEVGDKVVVVKADEMVEQEIKRISVTSGAPRNIHTMNDVVVVDDVVASCISAIRLAGMVDIRRLRLLLLPLKALHRLGMTSAVSFLDETAHRSYNTISPLLSSK